MKRTLHGLVLLALLLSVAEALPAEARGGGLELAASQAVRGGEIRLEYQTAYGDYAVYKVGGGSESVVMPGSTVRQGDKLSVRVIVGGFRRVTVNNEPIALSADLHSAEYEVTGTEANGKVLIEAKVENLYTFENRSIRLLDSLCQERESPAVVGIGSSFGLRVTAPQGKVIRELKVGDKVEPNAAGKSFFERLPGAGTGYSAPGRPAQQVQIAVSFEDGQQKPIKVEYDAPDGAYAVYRKDAQGNEIKVEKGKNDEVSVGEKLIVRAEVGGLLEVRVNNTQIRLSRDLLSAEYVVTGQEQDGRVVVEAELGHLYTTNEPEINISYENNLQLRSPLVLPANVFFGVRIVAPKGKLIKQLKIGGEVKFQNSVGWLDFKHPYDAPHNHGYKTPEKPYRRIAIEVTYQYYVPVDSVMLNWDVMVLEVGETRKLKETIEPFNATDTIVEWTSSNADVAAVDGRGNVVAKAEGEATITVKTDDGDKTAACVVKVGGTATPGEGVSLSKSQIDLMVGATAELVAIVTPKDAADKTVRWESSDESIATVDQQGRVTGVSAGVNPYTGRDSSRAEATITVTTNAGGKQAICKVVVKAILVRVVWNDMNRDFYVERENGVRLEFGELVASGTKLRIRAARGGFCELIATYTIMPIVHQKRLKLASNRRCAEYVITGEETDWGQKKVYFQADVGAQIYFDEQLVRIWDWLENEKKSGTTFGRSADSYKITLEVNVPPGKVIDRLMIGGMLEWKARSKSAWKQSYKLKKTDIADSIRVHISVSFIDKIPVDSVKLDATELSIGETASVRLTETVFPKQAHDKRVTWESDNEKVATVNAIGRVAAKKVGVANISAVSVDGGHRASCKVTVKGFVPVESVSLNEPTLRLKVGDTAILEPLFTPADATVQAVQWASSVPTVAQVDTSGKVTAIAEGKTWIIATSKDGERQGICKLTVLDETSPVESDLLRDVRLSPNPTTGRVAVYSLESVCAFEVFDPSGRIVLEGENNGAQFTIDISSLAPGVYFLRLIDREGRSVVRSVVKQ